MLIFKGKLNNSKADADKEKYHVRLVTEKKKKVRPPFQTNQIVEDVCVSAIPQTRQIVVGSIACFTVDYAFPSDTSQSNLYETCLSDLVNHFLQAFGKNNSGKSYSLFGPLTTGTFNDSSHGLILRATQQIFNSLSKIGKQGQYKLLISFLEFTNDSFNDLIAASQNHRECLQNEKVRTTASLFESVHCQNFNKVYNIIKTAIEARLHKNCTVVKQLHTVFIFTLQQEGFSLGHLERKEWKAVFTILGDCDCSPGTRHHIKANSNSNCSLRIFSEIIATTAQDAPEISDNSTIANPFLTNLLKDGLTGHSQTLVLCCVSPSTADYCDTLSQLSVIDKLRLMHVQSHFPSDMQSNADVFGLEFAVSQWERLVSDAEGLFQKLIEKDLPREAKIQIEQWLCLKQECSDCLVTDESTNNYEKITRSLERIAIHKAYSCFFFSDEVTEYEELSTEDHTSSSDCDSVEEIDSQLESDSIIEDDTATCLNSQSIVDNRLQDFEEKLEVLMHKFRDITNKMMDKQFGTKNFTINSHQRISAERASKSVLQNGEIISERRKSLILSEIETPQMNSSSVFQPITDQLFLEDKNGSVRHSPPINLQNCHYYERQITDKYRAIAMNYEKRLQDIELIKQLAGHSARKVANMENNLQNSKKRMQKLIKLLKRTEEHKYSLEKTIIEDQRRINELEEKCKLQFNSKPKILEATSTIKEENDIVRNESPQLNLDDGNSRICNKESLRQEIINLRKTREYLLEQRRNLDIKLNKDKVFTNAEERKFLELDEAIEAIDTVIEYKNEIICGHDIHLRDHTSDEKMEKRAGLSKYDVNKVYDIDKDIDKIQELFLDPNVSELSSCSEEEDLSVIPQQNRKKSVRLGADKIDKNDAVEEIDEEEENEDIENLEAAAIEPAFLQLYLHFQRKKI
uniref:Kinesin motor domain-containing protein n=1 Tax=Rhodnius prolixus TaxID=13249 RepID=T1HK02_RHOPR